MTQKNPSNKTRDWTNTVVQFFFWASLFSVAYAQAPLYHSNQHQYFLHGLAQGGYGHLDADWLANTADPTPLFSMLVSVTYQLLDELLFYFYYAMLMGVYVASLVGIFSVLTKDQAPRTTRLTFIALFFLIHSAVVRCLSARWFGTDYPWYFQAGVAGQYVLGPMFQPSTFGVFLILSLYSWARDRPMLAVILSSLGATMHTTYLLPAALLTLSYMLALTYEKRLLRGLLTGSLSLALVLPIVVRNWMVFRPTSSATFIEAQRILFEDRIPHHTIVSIWCDWIACAQVLWVFIGIVLAWRTRLFIPLLVTSLLSCGLTMVQVLTENHTLALLFPWRSSVILVPIATTIILTKAVSWCASFFQSSPESKSRIGEIAIWSLIGCLVVGGLAIMIFRLGFQTRDEELGMLEYVREQKLKTNVYLLPIDVPNLKQILSKPEKKGSRKSDFIPRRKAQQDPQFIKVNLQRFRLYTGAPIYVDFKSIPYKDTEVLEWKRRLDLNERLYAELKVKRGKDLDPVISKLLEEGITHIVAPTRDDIPDHPRLHAVFDEDRYFRVLEIR
ncbi:MAG: DUF6798 domain-containing protein [Gemmataceae bacterium]